MNIGKKIKELRLAKNLTLEELAIRSELTKGFLSQLERDLTSPSIATLDDILEVLGTNLSDFFREERATKIVYGKEDYYVNEDEGKTIQWIVPNAQSKVMEPLILTLEQNASSQEILPHDGEEFGYILNGCVTLEVGKDTYCLQAGETFYIQGKHRHILFNKEKEKTEIMWVMTPPNF